MCQGFSHFPGFLHHFVMAKLATSSIKVNDQSTPPELLSLCSTPLLPSPHHLIYPPTLHFLRLLTIMYLHLLSPLPPPSHPSNFLPPLFFPLLLRFPSPHSLHIPHLPLLLPLSSSSSSLADVLTDGGSLVAGLAPCCPEWLSSKGALAESAAPPHHSIVLNDLISQQAVWP